MARHHTRSPSPSGSSSKRPRTDERERERERDREREHRSSSDRYRDRDRDRDRDREERHRTSTSSSRRDDKDGGSRREKERERDKKSSTTTTSSRPRSRSRDRERERDGGGSSSRRSREDYRERERDHYRESSSRRHRSRSPGTSSRLRTASPALSNHASRINGSKAMSPSNPQASSSRNDAATATSNNRINGASPTVNGSAKSTETAEEEKLRLKRERLEAWKAKKAAEAGKAAPVPTPLPSTMQSTPTPAPQVKPKPAIGSTAARLGLPVASKLASASSNTASPTASSSSTILRSAPVGLPKKPAFSAFGKTASKGRATASTMMGMMDDDEGEKATLYKPEEGGHIEAGLEPDKPTAEQLEHMRRQDDALKESAADEEVKQEGDEEMEDASGQLNELDDDDEFADGGPSVKPAPLTAAQREAEREEREAAEIQARQDAKMEEADEAEDVDPLDAFMAGVEQEKKQVDREDAQKTDGPSGAATAADVKGKGKAKNALIGAFGDDSDEEADGPELNDVDKTALRAEDILALAQKKIKKRDLPSIDHSKMGYESFRRAFYHPPPEIAEMTEDEAEALRVELDNIKIRGQDCPKPITKWSHCGLPSVCLEVIRSLGYAKPTSIQSQAIPAIMFGRDMIGVAKTGSGKTLAFLLPLLRHVKDQRPLDLLEGPIAMVMTPTRELATQIAREAKPFLKALNLRVTAAYGGSPLKDNIADMKRGAEVIVCTPGRMIELLITNSGRIINLRRITYLVLDEADRMFDMGFEPQVMKILSQIRPDRQTVLFSATFPRAMEALAKKVLKRPLEITVGGRSVVAAEIEQIVEVREEDTKFNRLLEILGRYYNEDPETRSLIFVHRQDSADNLFKQLQSKSYSCMSLHGGKEQVDRDDIIQSFKNGELPILIATSVAARGLDVKLLKLVINYDCPNHMEDYVHRAGRTGRAGNTGTCITFITPDQDKYAKDLQTALEASKVEVPADLKALADSFVEKIKSGRATAASSGFGGKGLERLDQERNAKEKAQRSAYGEDDSKKEAADEEGEKATAAGDDSRGAEDTLAQKAKALDLPDIDVEIRRGAAPADSGRRIVMPSVKLNEANTAALAAAAAKAKAAGIDSSGITRAQEVVARLTASIQAKKQEQFGSGSLDVGMDAPREGDPNKEEFHAIVPINDYPQRARWKVTNQLTMAQLVEQTGAAVTSKGVFYEKGRKPGLDDPPALHLLVESNSEQSVMQAIRMIKEVMIDATAQALEAENHSRTGGRYVV